jgi:hypothetical protein
MAKLSNDEQKRISQQLKKKFNCDDVQFLGYKRFALINSKRIILEKGDSTIHPRIRKYMLADENSNIIRLNDEYNFIAKFIAGVAEVWKQLDYHIQETDTGHVAVDIRKYGLIDINGKELLPAIYDNVSAHIGGIVEITRDGVTINTNITVLKSDEFSWDDPYCKYRLKTAQGTG